MTSSSTAEEGVRTSTVLHVYRALTLDPSDQHGQAEAHRQRAELLHAGLERFSIRVDDWGLTDSSYEPPWSEQAGLSDYQGPPLVVHVVVSDLTLERFKSLVHTAGEWIESGLLSGLLFGASGPVRFAGVGTGAGAIALSTGLSEDMFEELFASFVAQT